MRESGNPVVRCLQQHAWQWVSGDEVMAATGCSADDLAAVMRISAYRSIIEQRDGEYRYISTMTSANRAMVEFLRDIHPRWADAAEIMGRTGTASVQRLVHYADVLPVEIQMDGQTKKFRYLSDDRKSLAGRKAPGIPAVDRGRWHTGTIMRVLRSHAGEWMTAREMAAELGLASGRCLAASLAVLVRDNARIERMYRDGANRYRYRQEAPA